MVERILVLSALIAVGWWQTAIADADHGHEPDGESEVASNMSSGDSNSQMGMMNGDMMGIMQNMMKMHAYMMQGGMDRADMMDREMMTMMMAGQKPHDMPAHMAVKLREFDADSSGALTLDEFEALHMSAIRDRMVDRFQHLDADGDGQITQEEMESAGKRMSNMKKSGEGSMAEDHHGDDKN